MQQLAAGALHDDAASLQDVSPVADLQGLEHVLFDQEHGDALGRDMFHGSEDLGDQLGHDAHGGFVQHEKIGPGHEPAGNRHLLLLAARKRSGTLVGALFEPREQPLDGLKAFGNLFLGVDGVGSEQQVVPHRQARKKPPPLGHQGDLLPDDLIGGQAGDYLAVQADLPLHRLQQAHDRLEQGSLAGPVRADQ